MSGNEYQKLAERTMRSDWRANKYAAEQHALHGMVGEIGEIHSIYQKEYQGHLDDDSHKRKEIGDLLWFIAEYCTVHGWKIEDIMSDNIEKLRKRYPDGFSTERSVNREKGDI